MSRDFTPPDHNGFGRDLPDSDARPVGSPSQDREQGEKTPPPRAQQRSPEHPHEDRRPEIPFRDGRSVLYDRDRGYPLSETEIRTVVELGKFRVIAVHDLS